MQFVYRVFGDGQRKGYVEVTKEQADELQSLGVVHFIGSNMLPPEKGKSRRAMQYVRKSDANSPAR